MPRPFAPLICPKRASPTESSPACRPARTRSRATRSMVVPGRPSVPPLAPRIRERTANRARATSRARAKLASYRQRPQARADVERARPRSRRRPVSRVGKARVGAGPVTPASRASGASPSGSSARRATRATLSAGTDCAAREVRAKSCPRQEKRATRARGAIRTDSLAAARPDDARVSCTSPPALRARSARSSPAVMERPARWGLRTEERTPRACHARASARPVDAPRSASSSPRAPTGSAETPSRRAVLPDLRSARTGVRRRTTVARGRCTTVARGRRSGIARGHLGIVAERAALSVDLADLAEQ